MIIEISILGFVAVAAYLMIRFAMSASGTNHRPSTVVFRLCFLSAVLALFASAFWITSAVRDSEAFAAMTFLTGVVPVLGGGTLLFCFVPSAVLYARGRQRSDLVSLWTSGISVAVIALEAALLLPLRGQ
jgi:hypothetical protein